ncbi:hypothetical protein BSL78_11400 [Apostichopus japonicus]|uniref:Uncharacterized protein n=1 Tax=Stichopus japonicus TaxID=307972 RepID=A0A2G8KUQ1_STIJA|nr:hypothetical protein BSL78_11400 [Apostichopus japonicus]
MAMFRSPIITVLLLALINITFGKLMDFNVDQSAYCLEVTTNVTLTCGQQDMALTLGNGDTIEPGTNRPNRLLTGSHTSNSCDEKLFAVNGRNNDIRLYSCFTDGKVTFIFQSFSSSENNEQVDYSFIDCYVDNLKSRYWEFTNFSHYVAELDGSHASLKCGPVDEGQMKLVCENSVVKPWVVILLLSGFIASVMLNVCFCCRTMKLRKVTNMPEHAVGRTYGTTGVEQTSNMSDNQVNCGYTGLCKVSQQNTDYTLLAKANILPKSETQNKSQDPSDVVADQLATLRNGTTNESQDLCNRSNRRRTMSASADRVSALESSWTYEIIKNDPDTRPPTYLDIEDDSEFDVSYDYTEDVVKIGMLDRLDNLTNEEYVNDRIGQKGNNPRRQNGISECESKPHNYQRPKKAPPPPP